MEETTDTTQQPKYEEGQVLAVHYTPEGPVKVVWREGCQKFQPPGYATKERLEEMKLKINELNRFAEFCMLLGALGKQKDRKVPVTLQEADEIVGKVEIKKLARRGLLEIQTLRMQNAEGAVQSRAFCWLTDEGRALRLELFRDKADAVTASSELPEELVVQVKANQNPLNKEATT